MDKEIINTFEGPVSYTFTGVEEEEEQQAGREKSGGEEFGEGDEDGVEGVAVGEGGEALGDGEEADHADGGGKEVLREVAVVDGVEGGVEDDGGVGPGGGEFEAAPDGEEREAEGEGEGGEREGEGIEFAGRSQGEKAAEEQGEEGRFKEAVEGAAAFGAEQGHGLVDGGEDAFGEVAGGLFGNFLGGDDDEEGAVVEGDFAGSLLPFLQDFEGFGV